MKQKDVKWNRRKIEEIIKLKNWVYKELNKDIYEISLSFYGEVHSINIYLRSYYMIVKCSSIRKINPVEIRSYKSLSEYLDIFYYEIKKSIWDKKDYVDKLLYISKEEPNTLEKVINIHCNNINNSITKAEQYINNINNI